MFEEDTDLLSGKKEWNKLTKHGRRASNPKSPSSPDEINTSSLEANSSPPPVPMRSRKTGGWADEGSKSGKSKSSINIIEQERFQNQIQDTDDDIPIIPDIDDIQDDPLNLPDVKIPNVIVKQSTYKELDNQFESGNTNLGSLGDIDLSLLTNRLFPEKEVQRCTEVWTMESLYQDFAKQ